MTVDIGPEFLAHKPRKVLVMFVSVVSIFFCIRIGPLSLVREPTDSWFKNNDFGIEIHVYLCMIYLLFFLSSVVLKVVRHLSVFMLTIQIELICVHICRRHRPNLRCGSKLLIYGL
jgi:isoprenylcysteine carboxyl methyltransferase (ICMT) family protein YpbQ